MIEPGALVRHEPMSRSLVVSSVKTLSPGFRRVTLSGEELDGFSSVGAADHVKVFFDDNVRRDYTPRAFRPGNPDKPAELDIDFFVHGGGPAAIWATSASVGDPLRIGGPRTSRLSPSGISGIIIGADESSLPATARWIELLPTDVEIFLFVELDNAADAAYLDPIHVHRARVVWLEKAPGVLEHAIRAFGPISESTYVWLAGEATTLVPIRRYLRHELGLPASQVRVDGYWRSGEAGRDHHSPLDPANPED